MSKLAEMLKYAADYTKRKKGGAKVLVGKGETLAGASVEELAEATEINAGRLADVFADAADGDPRAQAAVAFDLTDRDPALGAHVRTRRLAVAGCDWQIVATEDTDEERAGEIRAALDKAGMAGLIEHLASAAWYGYAGALCQWTKDGILDRFIHAHPTRWVFDRGGNPALSLPDKTAPEPISALEPGSAVFAAPAGGALPQRAGICRPVGWMWMFKRNAWLWRSRYLERFGMPVIHATVTEEQWQDKERLRKLAASLDNMGSRGRVITPEGAGLEFVTAVSSGANSDYQKYIDAANDEITLAVLGQLASSGDAGGLSKGQTQENVRLDLLAADCRMVEDAIQRHILNPLVGVSISESAVGGFVFKLDYEPNEDETSRANVVETLNRAGLELDEEWASKRFEMPLTRRQATAPGIQPMSDLSPRQAKAEGARRERTIEGITAAAMARLMDDPEAAAAWVAPLKSEIAAVFADIDPDSPDLPARVGEAARGLFERYPAVYAAMGGNAGAIENAVRVATMTAAAAANSRPLS